MAASPDRAFSRPLLAARGFALGGRYLLHVFAKVRNRVRDEPPASGLNYVCVDETLTVGRGPDTSISLDGAPAPFSSPSAKSVTTFSLPMRMGGILPAVGLNGFGMAIPPLT